MLSRAGIVRAMIAQRGGKTTGRKREAGRNDWGGSGGGRGMDGFGEQEDAGGIVGEEPGGEEGVAGGGVAGVRQDGDQGGVRAGEDGASEFEDDGAAQAAAEEAFLADEIVDAVGSPAGKGPVFGFVGVGAEVELAKAGGGAAAEGDEVVDEGEGAAAAADFAQPGFWIGKPGADVFAAEPGFEEGQVGVVEGPQGDGDWGGRSVHWEKVAIGRGVVHRWKNFENVRKSVCKYARWRKPVFRTW